MPISAERVKISKSHFYPQQNIDGSNYKYVFVFPWVTSDRTETMNANTPIVTELEEPVIKDPIGYNIATEKDNLENFGQTGEHAVYMDTLMYFPEHVWHQPISKYQYHLIPSPQTNTLRLISLDSAQPDKPVIEIFRRGVEYIQTLGRSPHREIAETMGFAQIEEACAKAAENQQNLSLLWFSPPGGQNTDYGTTGRTFMGFFDYQSGVLQIFNLIDSFDNTDRNLMWHHFSNVHQISDGRLLQSDVDFLSAPNIVLDSDLHAPDIIKLVDDWLGQKYQQKFILGKPAQQYDPNHQKALATLEPYLQPYIIEFIGLLKRNASRQELNEAFHGLTVLADKMFTQYIQNPEKPILLPVLDLDNLTKKYRYHAPVVFETSCPIFSANFDPNKPFAYLNAFVGPSDDFYCEVCGTKIKYGVGAKQCPTCHTPAVCV